MSKTIDNITLCIISLKQELESYLDANGWNRKYNMYLAGDEDLRGIEFVRKVTDTRKQVKLPVIILDTGYTRLDRQELGKLSDQEKTEAMNAILDFA